MKQLQDYPWQRRDRKEDLYVQKWFEEDVQFEYSKNRPHKDQKHQRIQPNHLNQLLNKPTGTQHQVETL